MKEAKVFINLRGTIGDYAASIRRETRINRVDIQGLQNRLNEVIRRFKDEPATMENCSLFWNSLEEEYRKVKIVPTNDVEKKALDEIVECIRKIGCEVAYFNWRSGAMGGMDAYLKPWWDEMKKGNNSAAAVWYKKFTLALISYKKTPKELEKYMDDGETYMDWEYLSEMVYNNDTFERRTCRQMFESFVFVNQEG